MMKSLLLSLFAICAIHLFAFGQFDSSRTTPPPPEARKKGLDPSRLVFGGNLGASFGNFTFVNVSPQVGYRLSEKFIAGAGVNFIYQSQKYFGGAFAGDVKESLGYAGLSVYGRYLPIRFLMLSVQPELNYNWGKINYENPNLEDGKLDGKFVPSLLLGGGLVLGRGFMVSVQYDVIQNNRSPYGRNAFVSFGAFF